MLHLKSSYWLWQFEILLVWRPKYRSKNKKDIPCENVMCKKDSIVILQKYHGMEKILNLIPITCLEDIYKNNFP